MKKEFFITSNSKPTQERGKIQTKDLNKSFNQSNSSIPNN